MDARLESALAKHGLLPVDAAEEFSTRVHTVLPAVPSKQYVPPAGTVEIRDIAGLRALLSAPHHASSETALPHPPPIPPPELLALHERARRERPQSVGCALDGYLARPEHKPLKRAVFNATQVWVAGDAERARDYAPLINTISFPRVMKVRIFAVERIVVAAGHPLEFPAAPDEFFLVLCAALEVEAGGVLDLTHALEMTCFATSARGDLTLRRVGRPGEPGAPGIHGGAGTAGSVGLDAVVSRSRGRTVCLRPAAGGNSGTCGGPGGDGVEGGNGGDVPCGVVSLGLLRGAPSIVAEIGGGVGGDGGAGGDGGPGGPGGPAGARCEACDCGVEAGAIGAGGEGGSGGAAGNGGDFGVLSVSYCPEDGLPRRHVVRVAGGAPGDAGAAGEGGEGLDGPSPSGQAGAQGRPGFNAGVRWCVT